MHQLRIGHGDLHLWNILVTDKGQTPQILFVASNMLHHPNFDLCKQYDCYTKHDRFKEDWKAWPARRRLF